MFKKFSGNRGKGRIGDSSNPNPIDDYTHVDEINYININNNEQSLDHELMAAEFGEYNKEN